MSDNRSVNLVFQKVSFVNKISTILKATSDDDKPLAGYLYQEISKITHESEGYCESTLEYLVDRLEKKSCHVKLKVIKLMKYLLENGHRDFRFGLLKNSQGITAATKYSGPPDPLHGNVPYIMVRKAAQELSELLFDTEMFDARHASQEGQEPTRRGDTGGLGSSGSRTGKLEGFGNSPAPQKKTFSDTVMDNVYKMAEKLSEQPSDHQRELLKSVQNVGGYKPPTSYHDDTTPLVTSHRQEGKSTTVKSLRKHIPGKAGGGWDDSDDDTDGYHGHSQSSGGKRSTGSNDLPERMDGVTIEDWTGEEQLVTSVVDNGQTFLLTRKEIRDFLQSCHQLSCYKVLELLNQRLRSGVDNYVMRSLLLVENFLTTDLIGIDQMVRICRENLVWLVGSNTRPISAKSNKIIRILEKLSNTCLLDQVRTVASAGQPDLMVRTPVVMDNQVAQQQVDSTDKDIELLLEPDHTSPPTGCQTDRSEVTLDNT